MTSKDTIGNIIYFKTIWKWNKNLFLNQENYESDYVKFVKAFTKEISDFSLKRSCINNLILKILKAEKLIL